MWSGRKGEESRECSLNSSPLESFFFLVFHLSKNQRRREKGIFFKIPPPSNLLLFFLCFFIRKIRGVVTRRFLFREVDFILNHRRGSGRKGEARMRSGRKEESRECILNSNPSRLFLFFVFHYSRNQRRREKGIYSKFHPPRIFFCFSYFILRKLRGEGRREFILNSTPVESSFVFVFHYSKIRGVETRVLFENQTSRDETVFVFRSKERGAGGRAAQRSRDESVFFIVRKSDE